MNELNPDRINLIIDAIITEFSKIYLTKRYFGEFENPYKEAIRLFTSGYCSIFAMILKRVFEDSTYYTYETSDTEHILVKIGDDFYDVRGIVPNYELEGGRLDKLNDVFEVPFLIPEDYLNGSHEKFYEEMIEVCSQAGLNYAKMRGFISNNTK